MGWIRQAGGFWVDPDGVETRVNSHGEWAWNHFMNQMISEEEQAEPVVEDLPLAGPKVEYKGTGGAEAKQEAEKKMREMGINSPLEAANKLVDAGWVRISNDDPTSLIVMALDYEHVLAAEEAILRAAKSAELVNISTIKEHDNIQILSANLSMGLKDAIEKARGKKTAPVQTSGLGYWRTANDAKRIDFFANIVHQPKAAVGKQWVVLDPRGKVVASGPSRKWAERSARRLDWFRRQQSQQRKP